MPPKSKLPPNVQPEWIRRSDIGVLTSAKNKRSITKWLDLFGDQVRTMKLNEKTVRYNLADVRAAIASVTTDKAA
jgi:hypothetical protein